MVMLIMYILKCSSLLLPFYLYIYSLYHVLLLCEINSIRWIAALGAYDFTIKYRTGKYNQDVDGLTRMPETDGIHEVSTDSSKALCQSNSFSPCVTSLSLIAESRSAIELYEDIVPRDRRRIQSQDRLVNLFVRAVTVSKKLLVSQVNTRIDKMLLREVDHKA